MKVRRHRRDEQSAGVADAVVCRSLGRQADTCELNIVGLRGARLVLLRVSGAGGGGRRSCAAGACLFTWRKR